MHRNKASCPSPPGAFPALVTPFGRDEGRDESAFRGLICHVIDDVDGLVPCGTTGEFPYLSVEEQKNLSILRVAYSVLGLTQHATRNTL